MSLLEQFECLDRVWEHFSSPSVSFYRIGPFILRLLSASDHLEQKITKAFAHLKLDRATSYDFTVCLWDHFTSQITPDLDWTLIQQNGRHGHCEPPLYFHYEMGSFALSSIHVGRNLAYYVVRDSQKLPWWVSGSPLQIILHVWLREHGLQLTHAAAVGDGQTAVLFSGKGGSGKSTTTLACLTEGLRYLSEDYCILDSKITQVFSVYQSAKWTPQTRILFPHYEQFIANCDTADAEKALIYYSDCFPEQIQLFSPVRALLSLKVGTENTPSLQEYDGPSALKDLMISTLLQLPFYDGRTIKILKSLVARVKRYQLVLGQDIKANTQMVRALLSANEERVL